MRYVWVGILIIQWFAICYLFLHGSSGSNSTPAPPIRPHQSVKSRDAEPEPVKCDPIVKDESSSAKSVIDNVLNDVQWPKFCHRFIINAGANSDPTVYFDDPNMCTVAFEPLLSTIRIMEKSLPHYANSTRLFVLPTAVSNKWGFRTFFKEQRRRGDSSSFHKLNPDADEENGGLKQEFFTPIVVPVIPLSAIVDAIPEDRELFGLKTDLQGHDFLTVSSLGDRIKRFGQVLVETYVGETQLYTGVENNFKKNFLPWFESKGFKLKWEPNCGPGLDSCETNTLWTNQDGKKHTWYDNFRLT